MANINSVISPVNIEHLGRKLREKRSELLSDLARLKDEARASGEAEVRDATDDATADQGSAEALQEVSMETRTLEQIDDALKRIDRGAYGNCERCGRPIPANRLEAIPWTPFCLDDAPK